MKRRSLIITSILICILASGCSYHKFEDKLLSKDAVNEQSAHAENDMSDDIEDDMADDVENITNDSSDSKSAKYMDAYQQEIDYTVEEVKIVKNLDELGLTSDSLNTLDDSETDTTRYLCATVNITNQNYINCTHGKTKEDQYIIGVPDTIYCNDEAFEAVYFSDPIDNEKSYFFIQLKEGDSANVRLVWKIDESISQDKILYLIGGGTDHPSTITLNED